MLTSLLLCSPICYLILLSTQRVSIVLASPCSTAYPFKYVRQLRYSYFTTTDTNKFYTTEESALYVPNDFNEYECSQYGQLYWSSFYTIYNGMYLQMSSGVFDTLDKNYRGIYYFHFCLCFYYQRRLGADPSRCPFTDVVLAPSNCTTERTMTTELKRIWTNNNLVYDCLDHFDYGRCRLYIPEGNKVIYLNLSAAYPEPFMLLSDYRVKFLISNVVVEDFCFATYLKTFIPTERTVGIFSHSSMVPYVSVTIGGKCDVYDIIDNEKSCRVDVLSGRFLPRELWDDYTWEIGPSYLYYFARSLGPCSTFSRSTLRSFANNVTASYLDRRFYLTEFNIDRFSAYKPSTRLRNGIKSALFNPGFKQ